MNIRSRLLATLGLFLCSAGYASAQPTTPTFWVNCSAGESLQDTVDLAPAGALIIVRGNCSSVTLRRNVTLSGRDRATITSHRDIDDGVNVVEGVRATLMNFTISGGDTAGLVAAGNVTLVNVRIEWSESGILLPWSGSVTGDAVEIANNRVGVDAMSGSVTLRRSVVHSNGASVGRCTDGNGGIDAVSATLMLEDSVVRDNRGGGLCLEAGTATLVRSAVTGNRGERGGIFVWGAAQLTLIQSSVTRNHSYGDGGGIALRWMYDGTTTLQMTNSTLAYNTSEGMGGGLFVERHVPGTRTRVSFVHTTVVGNTAEEGSGIWSAHQVNLEGSLISANRSAAGLEADCAGEGRFVSRGWTLMNVTGCIYLPAFGDLVGARPLLGAAAKAGVTEFVPLLKSSPGRDAIPVEGSLGGVGCATGVKADQRGAARPVGSRCDIGASEQ
jgi:hypothetical protein